MDINSDVRDAQDNELNEPLETNAADDPDGLTIQNQRPARILEYEEAALRTDPLAAVIGIGNAHFQRIFEHLGSAVLDVIDSGPQTVEQLRELAPEIRLMLKLRNAIEADLAVQSPDADQHAAAFPRGAKPKGIGSKVATTKRELLPKRWKGETSY